MQVRTTLTGLTLTLAAAACTTVNGAGGDTPKAGPAAEKKPIVIQPAPVTEVKVPEAADEDYAVYAAVSEGLITDKHKQFVVARVATMDTPSAESSVELAGEDAPEIQKMTLRDFLLKADQPAVLKDRFELKVPVRILPAPEFDAFFAKLGVKGSCSDGWTRFYTGFPESPGYAEFSRVGYNPNKTQALVYRAFRWGCPSKASNGAAVAGADGSLFYLAKRRGKWEVQQRLTLWQG